MVYCDAHQNDVFVDQNNGKLIIKRNNQYNEKNKDNEIDGPIQSTQLYEQDVLYIAILNALFIEQSKYCVV